ncbi:hypothetical protein D8Z79_010620 [Escherichia fergusonii]|uniref:hypothetical protein n=1 Tax=Escherichia fergusonii TaxID=564 RepID=UPI000F6787BD|nr:hypothetical protein [Escherichia fergusonii]QCZ32244.1 hypothetical protein D8Z79_010620 [Escherichia fergusonii]
MNIHINSIGKTSIWCMQNEKMRSLTATCTDSRWGKFTVMKPAGDDHIQIILSEDAPLHLRLGQFFLQLLGLWEPSLEPIRSYFIEYMDKLKEKMEEMDEGLQTVLSQCQEALDNDVGEALLKNVAYQYIAAKCAHTPEDLREACNKFFICVNNLINFTNDVTAQRKEDGFATAWVLIATKPGNKQPLTPNPFEHPNSIFDYWREKAQDTAPSQVFDQQVDTGIHQDRANALMEVPNGEYTRFGLLLICLRGDHPLEIGLPPLPTEMQDAVEQERQILYRSINNIRGTTAEMQASIARFEDVLQATADKVAAKDTFTNKTWAEWTKRSVAMMLTLGYDGETSSARRSCRDWQAQFSTRLDPEATVLVSKFQKTLNDYYALTSALDKLYCQPPSKQCDQDISHFTTEVEENLKQLENLARNAHDAVEIALRNALLLRETSYSKDLLTVDKRKIARIREGVDNLKSSSLDNFEQAMIRGHRVKQLDDSANNVSAAAKEFLYAAGGE